MGGFFFAEDISRSDEIILRTSPFFAIMIAEIPETRINIGFLYGTSHVSKRFFKYFQFYVVI